MDAALGGCAGMSLERLPIIVSLVERISVSFPKYIVRTPELRSKAARLELVGIVARAFGADITEHTHRTISFCDRTGRILQSDETDFAPHNLVLV
jgi:hypothetical protein